MPLGDNLRGYPNKPGCAAMALEKHEQRRVMSSKWKKGKTACCSICSCPQIVLKCTGKCWSCLCLSPGLTKDAYKMHIELCVRITRSEPNERSTVVEDGIENLLISYGGWQGRSEAYQFRETEKVRSFCFTCDSPIRFVLPDGSNILSGKCHKCVMRSGYLTRRIYYCHLRVKEEMQRQIREETDKDRLTKVLRKTMEP